MRLLGAASRIGLCPVNVKPPAWPGDTYFEDEDYLAVTYKSPRCICSKKYNNSSTLPYYSIFPFLPLPVDLTFQSSSPILMPQPYIGDGTMKKEQAEAEIRYRLAKILLQELYTTKLITKEEAESLRDALIERYHPLIGQLERKEPWVERLQK